MGRRKKNDAIEIMTYFSQYLDDSELNVWHLAILAAILNLGYRQGQRCRINVSRSRIMALSHINTLPTYHKYMKELQNFGYINYKPSYHPGYRSEIELSTKRMSK